MPGRATLNVNDTAREVKRMRMIGAMADRVLSAVVPKTTAAACIDAGTFQELCYCSGGWWYEKNCVSTCYGPACGSCYRSSIAC